MQRLEVSTIALSFSHQVAGDLHNAEHAHYVLETPESNAGPMHSALQTPREKTEGLGTSHLAGRGPQTKP